ncbi:ScbR family autoregulator-binding transcription factor [Streptomyces sp. ID05-04B]|uniref:ScbR family autoregulator-binding transcription factor n=1 Tax=unclassified Streptomyces TaxID=2593676 RepID=UPI000D1BD5B0|nr:MULTISPECIES: ScbR family autoregulator-binding transcription factor [unclassified Streptomyces]AVV44434.1 TetR family transcriptional regulator [Streptomyces sp. P3]MDX5570744.1 ScbR family autoregulator-binding transcription factor [Streptomyces sp. ID05-04B]
MVKQARAVRTRRALVRAAAEVFAAEGYAGASLPAISERAGVSNGALHFHFASKHDLAAEVERAAADGAQRLAERCRSRADTLLQSLVHTACALLLAVVADPVIRAGFRLSGDPSRKDGTRLLRWWQAWVQELVVQAQRDGELARDVPADVATTVIVAATAGFEVMGAADREVLSVERVTQLWTFVLPRLAAPPGHASTSKGPQTPVEQQGDQVY